MTRSAPAAEEQSITLVRVIAAPVAEVFAAWTNPMLIRRWMVPILCRILEVEADPRPGGSFRMVITGPLGGRHVTTGEYREVVLNRRLVQTWVLEGYGKTLDRYPTTLTVDFRELGPRETEITVRQEQLLTKQDRSGNLMGWKMCLRKLNRLLRT
jgi:uncharacterized protein YndB with AHSA1/START domain